MVMRLSAGEIARAVGSSIDPACRQTAPSGYSIDSRTLQVGNCFVAIRGTRFDGHRFIPEAVRKGASLLIVSREEAGKSAPGTPCIRVEDTLKALQQLAGWVRRRWGKPLIGITGSVGKTTAKEIASHVLAGPFKVFRNHRNFNNHYGLPLSLLQLEPAHQIAVMELGMSAPGEIARLTCIARPELGVVTNVKPVHLEFFPSVDGIAKAKRELIEHLPPEGAAFLNNDDSRVRKFSRFFSGDVVTFGIERPAAFHVDRIRCRGLSGCDFRVRHRGRSYRLTSPLLGAHNVSNCLPGIALAHRMQMSFPSIAARLLSLKPGQGRGQPLYFEQGICVVDDSYNSNPAALMTMMRLLNGIRGYGRKILVAGEMMELGADAPRFHQVCGKAAAGWGFDLILGVRGLADRVVTSARDLGYDASRSVFFEDAAEAGEWLAPRILPGDLILVKGSRGVRTEGVIQRLKEEFALSA
ncbi:MAG: UDP-N-acetylmuramoyl-tripeptide--D-alanyl-D-alanine ligase [Acidobacteria bacterium]|nr:UDP-N-acetylmuramoyl-tripeptide--D-alanyl-D-alanine ligase [Acidobacteriota bacterium]